ncbi:MAG TPA: hypothetical protein VMU81_25320 [Acetobacteraceae bacterium]|jgi:hypothetical protein|nr:hypothetical protein [Acetobacteraceae bacterium]
MNDLFQFLAQRRPLRRMLAVGLIVLGSGCTNELAQRQAFLNQFVGHPEQGLIETLGVPNRSYTAEGVKYLAYDERRVTLIPPLPPYGAGPWWYYGWYDGGAPAEAVELKCETTFTVAGGVVKSYMLRGNACG